MVRSRRANQRFARRRPRRRMGNNLVTECLISTVTVGKIGIIGGVHLTNVPSHSVWRPVSVTVQTAPVSEIPYSTQVLLYGAPADQAKKGTIVASSRVILVAQVPRTVTVRYPRNASWYPPLRVTQPSEIVNLSTICMKSESNMTVAYTVTMRIAIKNEILGPTCPNSLQRDHDSFPDDQSDYSLV